MPREARMKDKVDVLIIGAGASGAAAAWSLAETRMKILCLEQGDWMKQSDYPSNGRDYEARLFADYATSPNIRKRAADYPINDDASPIKVVNFNAVGGSTVMFTAHYPRLHPSDFRVRSLDGVADDWPIDYATLEPFFAENDRMTGVSGLAGDPAYPAHTPPMPPLPLGKSGAKIGRTMNRLGWHWWPSDSAVATTEYDGRAPCIHLGHCTPACAQGAKSSTDITYWPHAIRAGVELRTNCRVREITVGDDGMATGAVYYDADGLAQFQPAEVVIMACNGVGTARLLLHSTSGRFPHGLANSSGLVGKNLMFHPWAQVIGYVDEPMDGHRGSPLSLWSQEFYETDRSRGFVRGFNFQFVRGVGVGTEAVRRRPKGCCPGARATTTYFVAWSAIACTSASAPRTCPRSTTASPWTRCWPMGTASPRRASSTRSARTPAAWWTSRSRAAARSCRPPGHGTSMPSTRWCMPAGICWGRLGWGMIRRDRW